MNTRIRRADLDHLIDSTTGDNPGLLLSTTLDEEDDFVTRELATMDVAGRAWMTRTAWELAVHHANAGTRMRTKPTLIDEPMTADMIPAHAT